MNRFVLDASVALAWVLDVPIPMEAMEARQELVKGRRALVPALWHFEVANGLFMAERRRYLTKDEVDLALTRIESAVTGAIDTEANFVPVREAFTMARGFQLTAYDAAYLTLARQEGLPLATLDKELRAAAVKAGVALLK